MGALRTLISLLCLVPFGSVCAADLTQVFATCTGRFSAELENAWLLQSNHVEVLEERRERFEELLGTVTSGETARSIMDQRIKAKSAHARLLQIAQFAQDAGAAGWAKRRAEVEIGYCANFLLEG